MNEIISYQHHGNIVKVREDLKGKHRDYCLCHQNCAKFKPGQPDHCRIAADTFNNCVKNKLTTPVWECPEYEQNNKN